MGYNTQYTTIQTFETTKIINYTETISTSSEPTKSPKAVSDVLLSLFIIGVIGFGPWIVLLYFIIF